MYFKKLRYEINEATSILTIYIYSNRLSDWVKLAHIKDYPNGDLVAHFYGELNSDQCVHFSYFETAKDIRYDLMQFIHSEFKFVNEPDDFDAIINSRKLMAEINKREAE